MNDSLLSVLPPLCQQAIIEEALCAYLGNVLADASTGTFDTFVETLTSDARWPALRHFPMASIIRPGAGAPPPAAASHRRRGSTAPAQQQAKRKIAARRSSEAVTALVQKALAVIQENPGIRGEEIVRRLGGEPWDVKYALQKLRESGRVRTEGVKRTMTYRAL